MKLDKEDDILFMEKEFELTIDDEISYWMRWGMDNIGNDDPALSQPLRIFSSGMVSEEDRRNRIIDSVEINEFESQMGNLAITYMNDGMALELEELIGTDVQNLDQISFEVDFHGEKRVTPHPLTLKISTIEVVEQNVVIDILRDFIVVQPAPIWANIDISVNIETGMGTSSCSSRSFLYRVTKAYIIIEHFFSWKIMVNAFIHGQGTIPYPEMNIVLGGFIIMRSRRGRDNASR